MIRNCNILLRIKSDLLQFTYTRTIHSHTRIWFAKVGESIQYKWAAENKWATTQVHNVGWDPSADPWISWIWSGVQAQEQWNPETQFEQWIRLSLECVTQNRIEANDICNHIPISPIWQLMLLSFFESALVVALLCVNHSIVCYIVGRALVSLFKGWTLKI